MAAILSEKKLIQIARGEKTFLDFGTEQDIEECTFYSPVNHQMSLDDLVCALKNFDRKQLTMKEFGDWYYPISMFENMFGLDWMRRKQFDLSDWQKLLKKEQYVFYYIWNVLDEAWTNPDWKERGQLTYAADLPALIELGENCLQNQGKAVSKCVYAKILKEKAIDSWVLQGLSKKPWQIKLARQFTEELSKEDSIPALRSKAFACAYGTPLFEQDVRESLKCYEKLYSLTQQSEYAVEAGILSRKLRMYDQAFRYLSIGHVDGWYRASMDLGILLITGHGCPKSCATGRKLLNDVYFQMRDRFTQGNRNIYLETAAYKLAGGIRYLPHYRSRQSDCYAYELMAAFLVNWKIRYGYQDLIVMQTAAQVKDQVRRVQARLPESFFSTDRTTRRPDLLDDLVDDFIECDLEIRHKKGRTILHVWRLYGENELLIPMPERACCFFNRHVVYELPEDAKVHMIKERTSVDETEWNDTLCRQEFYLDGELIGWVEADEYTLLNCAPHEVKGPLVNVVIVQTDHGIERAVDQTNDRRIMPQTEVKLILANGKKVSGTVLDAFPVYASEVTDEEAGQSCYREQ